MPKFFEVTAGPGDKRDKPVIIKTEKTSPLLDDENTKAIIRLMHGLKESDEPELEIHSIVKAEPDAARRADKELTVKDKTSAGVEFYKKPKKEGVLL